jgi:uncharacterized membrane protein (DUF106 family)
MPILTLLATPLGRGAIVVLALVLALIVNNSHQRSIGAEKVVAKMEKAADANAKKAEAARKSVDAIPDDRLRDKHFRD